MTLHLSPRSVGAVFGPVSAFANRPILPLSRAITPPAACLVSKEMRERGFPPLAPHQIKDQAAMRSNGFQRSLESHGSLCDYRSKSPVLPVRLLPWRIYP